MTRLLCEAVVVMVVLSCVYVYAMSDTTAERRAFIATCEANGGIPVVIAGELSSRGIGCAAPLGD